MINRNYRRKAVKVVELLKHEGLAVSSLNKDYECSSDHPRVCLSDSSDFRVYFNTQIEKLDPNFSIAYIRLDGKLIFRYGNEKSILLYSEPFTSLKPKIIEAFKNITTKKASIIKDRLKEIVINQKNLLKYHEKECKEFYSDMKKNKKILEFYQKTTSAKSQK